MADKSVSRRDRVEELHVPIDVSKYFHRTMICAPGGKIIRNQFEVDVYSEGLEKLLGEVQKAKNSTGAKRVIFALEPTSYYHENLYKRLKMLNETVLLINPTIVSKIRDLSYRRIKTDDIDVQILAQAIEEQKGIIQEGREGKYAQLRILTRARWRKVIISKRLKTSIHEYVDKLWPGFCNRADSSKSLCSNLWESDLGWAILQICPNPEEVAKMTPKEFENCLKAKGIKGVCGPKRSLKVVEHAKRAKSLACYHPHLEFCLRQDIQELHHINEDMQILENQMMKVYSDFPELLYFSSIGSISPVIALSFIAEVGDIRRFATAKQLVHYTGLSVSYRQSGQFKSKHNHIIKDGNKYLRFWAMTISRSLSRCNPGFKRYFQKFHESQQREFYVAVGVVANKFIHVIHHLVTKEVVFDVNRLL